MFPNNHRNIKDLTFPTKKLTQLLLQDNFSQVVVYQRVSYTRRFPSSFFFARTLNLRFGRVVFEKSEIYENCKNGVNFKKKDITMFI